MVEFNVENSLSQDIKNLYEKTGTLAPLVNKREYTQDEKTVLLYFFTNVDKNVYCPTDAMSSQLWAFLMGQYSRSDLSMRDRFLKLIEDSEIAFNEGKIEKSDFISLSELAKEIKESKTLNIKFFNDKASAFLKKWGVDYGHNSLKDADRIRFAIEGVSQVFTKVIEAPFPALGDFQEKSTRYMNFGKENIIYDPVLLNSEFRDEIISTNEELMDLYEKSILDIKELLVANKIIKKEDFQRESAFNNTLNAKAFDICRYLLPSGVRTCLGAGFSARTLEAHLSEMLSHPLTEVRLIAKSMHNEALKISPGLLSHVKINEYFVNKRQNVLDYVNEIFYKKDINNLELYKGIDNAKRLTLISTDDIDNSVVASILFEYGRQKGISYLDCLNRVEMMSNDVKDKILDLELGSRGKFDRMPRSIQHGKILFDLFTDFGAYRDYQRHRASPQIWQGVTAIYGFDYPELIDLPGFDNFKESYDKIMGKITILSKKIIDKYPYEIEYVAALGHLVRTTFEMNPGQLAYVLELRTTPQGHHSYRTLFLQMHKIIEDKAPLFSKYIRVNYDFESSRKAQEEKAAKKREELGLK